MENCREVLVQETINLLKQMPVDVGDEVSLGGMLILSQRNGNLTNTVVCDHIANYTYREDEPFYEVMTDGYKTWTPCNSLTIDSLMAVYEAVRKVVREY